MKAEAKVLDVTTTLDGERVKMTMDENSTAHLMAVLTDLYSDKELAVVREYSTNALDAHVEAGVTRPIEVTLPSSLAPFFRVRDFGYGLDINDIRDIYSKYGASTKRASDEVVGMLGLGCKSALTYTDQFTITSTKNGRTTQVSVSRDEDGAGSMTIVAEYESTDESGTEVIVPAMRGNYFEAKAKDFYRFWKPGTVLVNGVEPKKIDGLWLAPDLLLTEEAGQAMVVMGNVPYPMGRGHGYGHQVVAFVNIGEVNFTPSREALMMTKKTQATIERINNRVRTETAPALDRILNDAPTKREALALSFVIERAHGTNHKLTYKGTPLPKLVEAPHKTTKVTSGYRMGQDVKEYTSNWIGVQGHKNYGKGWTPTEKVPSRQWETTIWLTGWTGEKFSPYKRLKLEQWIAENNVARPQLFMLVDEVPAGAKDWIDPASIMNWADVEAQKIVKENVKRNDGRPSGSYQAFLPGKDYFTTMVAGDIDTTKPIFFAIQNYGEIPSLKLVRKLNPDATIVRLTNNRVAKFQRDFPTAQNVKDYSKFTADKWAEGLTHAEKLFLTLQHSSTEGLQYVDPTEVDDPEVKEAAKLVNEKNQTLLNAHDLYRMWTDVPEVKWSNPLYKYALLTPRSFYGTMNARAKKHLYLYLNAAYAAEKKETN